MIPGECVVPVDLRAPSAEARDAAEHAFRTGRANICAKHGIGHEVTTVQQLIPCLCDEAAQTLLAKAITAQGLRPFHLASGAGHDAMCMAALGKLRGCGHGGAGDAGICKELADTAEL